MIENGPSACKLKDSKGYLPAHVACSYRCSLEKLRMLLNVHPKSLIERTNEGDTLLSLAKANKYLARPLIRELERMVEMALQKVMQEYRLYDKSGGGT